MVPIIETWQTFALLVDGLSLFILASFFRRSNLTISPSVVFASTPWIVSTGGFYALKQAGAFPPSISPFFEFPVLYATLYVLFLWIWLGALSVSTATPHPTQIARIIFTSGSVLVAIVFLVGSQFGVSSGTLEVFWPMVMVVLAGAITAVTWRVLGRVESGVSTTGRFGPLVLFSHTLDAVSTAVGIAVLGMTERNPISALVIDATADFPVVEVFGPAGGFVVMKILLAGGIVRLFSETAHDDSVTGALILEGVAATGLAPGVHNIVLFSVT